MSGPSTLINLPPPNSPLTQSGELINESWYQMLQRLINSVDGFTGIISTDDLQILADQDEDIEGADAASLAARLAAAEALIQDYQENPQASIQDVQDALLLAYVALESQDQSGNGAPDFDVILGIGPPSNTFLPGIGTIYFDTTSGDPLQGWVQIGNASPSAAPNVETLSTPGTLPPSMPTQSGLGGSPVATTTFPVTTVHANKLVICIFIAQPGVGVTSVVSSGLTFTREGYIDAPTPEDIQLWVYTAPLSGPLTSQNVTVTMNNLIGDVGHVMAFGVIDAGPLESAFPVTAIAPTPMSVTYSTTNAIDMLMYLGMSEDNTDYGAPAGFTDVYNAQGIGPARGVSLTLATLATSSVLSGASTTSPISVSGGTNNALMMMLAYQNLQPVNWEMFGTDITLTDGVNTLAGVKQITVSGATVGGTTPNATLAIPSPALTITDGTHTVDNVGTLTVSGGTVGGTSPNATLAISGGGGGSSQFNVTPDTHGSAPTGVGVGPNDEFEFGSVLDTTGARYASATGWTAHNQNNTVIALANGALVFSASNSGVNDECMITQPIVNPTAAFSFVTKQGAMAGDTGSNQVFSGVGVVLGSTGQGYYFGRYTNLPGNLLVLTQNTYAGAGVAAPYDASFANLNQFDDCWLMISYNGTTLSFSASLDGNIYETVFTATASGFDSAGLHIGASGQISAWNAQVTYDYLRRLT